MLRLILTLVVLPFALALSALAPRPAFTDDVLRPYAAFMPGQPIPACDYFYVPTMDDTRLCVVKPPGATLYLSTRGGRITYTTLFSRIPLGALVQSLGHPTRTRKGQYTLLCWGNATATLWLRGFGSLFSSVSYVSFERSASCAV